MSSVEKRQPGAARSACWPGVGSSPLGRGFSVLLALATLALLALITVRVAQQPVSFDGAMNLQVAAHLAEGGGYERPYSSLRPFPHEVQSNAPFVLVAALVFALFGVGLFKAQATNLLYLYGLCALAGGSAGVRLRGCAWPWLVVLAILTTPGLLEWGMNGYGEIPGLTWWLLANVLLFLCPPGRGVLLAAGACLAFALLTKTVMLLPVGCTLAVWGLWRLTVEGLAWRRLSRAVAWVLVGLMLPVIAFEAWRYAGVGGWAEYLRWWSWEAGAIQMQAGVAPGFEDTPNRVEKLTTHFRVLSEALNLSNALTALWLAVPLLLTVASLRSLRGGYRWLVVALMVTVLAYFAWWLLLTPTQKAWYRRILNGMVLVQLLWVHGIWWLWNRRPVERGTLLALRASSALLLALVLAHGLNLRLEKSLEARDLTTFRAGIHRIQSLPDDALLLGQGWYSAPTIQLYSGRRIRDLNRLAVPDLDGQVFGVRDGPGRQGQALQLLLDAYAYEELIMEPDFELFRIDTTQRRHLIPEFDEQQLRGVDRFVSEQGPYDLSRGVTGDRWAKTLAELILQAQSVVDAVYVETFTPNVNFVHDGPVQLRVFADGCDLGRQALATPGTSRLVFELPAGCRIEPGQPVRISLESNNMVWPRDQRQLSYVLKEVALRYATQPSKPVFNRARSAAD